MQPLSYEPLHASRRKPVAHMGRRRRNTLCEYLYPYMREEIKERIRRLSFFDIFIVRHEDRVIGTT